MKEKVEKMTKIFRSYQYNHRSIIDSKFRENGLYFGQPPILKYLSENENATQKEIADFFHSINIPDNSRETVNKYVNNFWVTPIPKPFCYTGIAGLYNPLTNFCITKDDILI